MDKMNSKKGFTLLEMMIVVALTVIILGLVFGPLMQTFGLTRRAQIMIRAQDNARLALNQISRDLGDAMYVYDNTRDPINFPVVDSNGSPTTAQVYYAKVDLVLPRMHGYCTAPDNKHDPNNVGNPREFDRGDESAPVCKYDGTRLELRPVQPLAPDTVIVRYFIALQDPSKPYCNPYANKKSDSGDKNMYVLYRAEFSPLDDASGKNALFPKGRSANENLADPNFFYNTDTNSFGEPYWQAWKKISRIIVNPTDTDLVTVDTSGAVPIVTPTVKFAPTSVYNDPLTPVIDRNDDVEHGDIPPVTYKATYGQWVLPYEVTLFRDSDNIYTTRSFVANSATGHRHMGVFNQANVTNGVDPDPTLKIFDITQYEETRDGHSDSGVTWTGDQYGAGKIDPANPKVAFTVDTRKGMVNFAFPHVNIGVSGSLSSALGGNMAASLSITTKAINSLYACASQGEDRFRLCEFNLPTGKMHLVTRTSAAGTSSYAFNTTQYLGNSTNGTYSTVVPGMEKVYGPCATSGNSYGQPMLYSRVPFWNLFTEPAINQYKLDIDYPVRGNNGNTVSGMEGTAALYFHAGQTESGPGTILPEDPNNPNAYKVYVLYYEQNNRKGDSLRANYVTKSLMTVIMGIKVYDNNTGDSQSIQLTNKIRLKNVAT